MPKVTFIDAHGDRYEIAASTGLSILAIARANNIDINGICNGEQVCSTCHVIVDPNWYPLLPKMDQDEKNILELAFGLTETSRLGCQIILTEKIDGIVLSLPK